MDIEKIRNLLHIAESSVKWPSLKGLHDAAMAELVKHSVEQAKLAEDARKKAAEEAAAIELKRRQAAEAQREKDAKAVPSPAPTRPVVIPAETAVSAERRRYNTEGEYTPQPPSNPVPEIKRREINE